MKTVGQALAEARRTKGITLREAERETKIRSELLLALERDDFTSLPSATYIKGFITNYGDYLGLGNEHLLALFRRQYDESKDKQPAILPDLAPKERPRLTLTPGRVLGFGVAILVLGFLGYLLAQYQSFAAAPMLQVDSPVNLSKVNDGSIQVVGRTDRDATLRINGQQVDLTPSGAFSVAMTLPDGTTDLNFSSANKLGRITTLKRTVTVQTSQAANPLGPVQQASSSASFVAGAATMSATPQYPLVVTLKIGPNDAWVQVEDDATSYCNLYLASRTTKTFNAQQQIIVQTGNAGSTDVTVNGIDKGVLGSSGQAVIHQYTPQSDSVLDSMPACK